MPSSLSSTIGSYKWVLIGAVLALGAFAAFDYSSRDIVPDLAPFYPTPMVVVDRMLELAAVTASDVVYDLGCGDGRIVIAAATKYGARGVGVEYDPPIAQRAIDAVKRSGLEGRVEIIEGDATRVDVSPASVVMLYLLPDTIARVRPNLDTQLRAGSRVVSHDAPMPGWTPVTVEKMQDETGKIHTLYAYRVGN